MMNPLTFVWLKTSFFFFNCSWNAFWAVIIFFYAWRILLFYHLFYFAAVKMSTVRQTLAPLKIVFLFFFVCRWPLFRFFSQSVFLFLFCNFNVIYLIADLFLIICLAWNLWASWICRLLFYRPINFSTTISSDISPLKIIFYLLCYYSCPDFSLFVPFNPALPIPSGNPSTIVHVRGSCI